METVLNLFWLTLALTALGHFIAKVPSDSPERSKALRLTALVMLLVLLFPVISLTDDLQAAATLAEGERAGVRMVPNDSHPTLQASQLFPQWSEPLTRPTTQRVAMAMADSPLEPSPAVTPYALGQRPPPSRVVPRFLNS